ncbi:MAG: ribosome maturation factor RimM, partial [Stellaceae bacterium]
MALPRPDLAMARPDRVLLGVITGAHGVRGEVRVKSFAAVPKAIASYGPLEDKTGKRFVLTLKGGIEDRLIAVIEGVATREAAERLKGAELYVPRDALPPAAEEEFYYADLVGLDVRLSDGAPFGRIAAVQEFGAGDCLEIDRGEGGTVLVP